MKINNEKYGLSIKLCENEIVSLIIEKPEFMRDIVNDLLKQSDGKNGNFILYSDEEAIRIDKNVYVVFNPFLIDFNDKKILEKIYEELRPYANDLIEEKIAISKTIIDVMDKILLETSYQGLIYNDDFEWKDLFKIVKLRIEEDELTFIEKISEFMKILTLIGRYKIIVLINISAYINDNELEKLIEMARYYKLNLIIVDNIESKYKFDRTYILDKDMCIVEKN